MIITQRIPIIQSRRLSRKITKCVRECDIVYDMSILMERAHPGLSQYDLNYMTAQVAGTDSTPDWNGCQA